TLRMALASEAHPLAVGVIHSHPRGMAPVASTVDDDMDSYYARYFGDFAAGRPYISLIVSEIDDELVVGGRAYWQNEWLALRSVRCDGTRILTWGDDRRARPSNQERNERLRAAFGNEAADRL